MGATASRFAEDAPATAEDEAAAAAAAAPAPAPESDVEPLEGALTVHVLKGADLIDADIAGSSDSYVRIKLGDVVQKTEVIENGGNNPVWNETFVFNLKAGPATAAEKGEQDPALDVSVWDEDTGGDDTMGNGLIPISYIFSLLEKGARTPGVVASRSFTLGGVKSGKLYLSFVWAPWGKSPDNAASVAPAAAAASTTEGSAGAAAPAPAAAAAAGSLSVHIKRATGLRKADTFGKSDPYCKATWAGNADTAEQTRVIDNTLEPEWDETFVFKVSQAAADAAKGQNDTADSTLLLQVYDEDTGSDELLGVVSLSLRAILAAASITVAQTGSVEQWHTLTGSKASGQMLVNVTWTPAA